MSSGTTSAAAKQQNRIDPTPAANSPAALSAGTGDPIVRSPAYPGDIWALQLWIAGAALLVLLHITGLLGCIFR